MTKRSAIGIADLLEFALSPQGLDDLTAELLGYERKSGSPSASSQQRFGLIGGFQTTQEVDADPEPAPEIPTERPRLKLLRAIKANSLKAEPPSIERGNPIKNEDLCVRWDKSGLPLRPLVPWSRLGLVLKNRLGAEVSSSKLDIPKLIQMVTSGVPLKTLPRVRRTAWANEAVLLWDFTREMWPFTADIQWLHDRLELDRGLSGLKIIPLRNIPTIADFGSIPAGTPILAISAMGQFFQSHDIQAAWIALGRQLKDRGHTLQALNPCPRDRWQPAVVRAWATTLWDRGQRLPRRGGMSALPFRHPPAPLVERLLTLLSTASLIEPPLLREARLLVGQPANAGTEWEAWHHRDCWQTDDCFGFESGDAYAKRLEHRATVPSRERDVANKVTAAICTQHASYSRLIEAEAELRACLSGTLDVSNLKRIAELFQQVVDRLRIVAVKPGGQEGIDTGLPAWFTELVELLPPTMRGNVNVAKPIAQGLALAYTWSEQEVPQLPSGVDAEAFAKELREAGLRVDDADLPVEYVVGLDSVGLQRTRLSFFPAAGERRPQTPLGRMLVGGNRGVQVEFSGSPERNRYLQLKGDVHDGVTLDAPPSQFKVVSSHASLELAAFERPPWASRFWQDQYGLAAEFLVRDVAFVLRWIPPGRFLMGSPESEEGRYQDEGPQHEVRITRGFWLGETPVTQSQWAAVVETGTEQQKTTKEPLELKPSQFTGSQDLPVENVSWNHSEAYCGLLNALLPDTPVFRIPTEAEWEYACRAGTQSAFHDGSACTVPKGLDPALDRLGWFDKNSKQQTHPVKEKQPNGWGLYDLHGNVLEWCLDGWDTAAYQSRAAGKDGVDDPFTVPGESADRVVLPCGVSRPQRPRPRLGHPRLALVRRSGARESSGGAGVFLGAERLLVPKRRSRG